MTDKMTRGRNKKETLEDVIIAAKSIPGPVFGAQELADHAELSLARRTAHNYAEDLVEQGLADTKQFGDVRVYWLCA